MEYQIDRVLLLAFLEAGPNEAKSILASYNYPKGSNEEKLELYLSRLVLQSEIKLLGHNPEISIEPNFSFVTDDLIIDVYNNNDIKLAYALAQKRYGPIAREKLKELCGIDDAGIMDLILDKFHIHLNPEIATMEEMAYTDEDYEEVADKPRRGLFKRLFGIK
jgi:hypothetical protein